MAYTLDDIKRIRDGVKTKKGDGASSSPSSDSIGIDRIKSIRDSVAPAPRTSAPSFNTPSQNVYDDYVNTVNTYNVGGKDYTKEEVIDRYESLPTYNFYQRMFNKDKSDAYKEKQAFAQAYQQAKDTDMPDLLKQAGVSPEEMLAIGGANKVLNPFSIANNGTNILGSTIVNSAAKADLMAKGLSEEDAEYAIKYANRKVDNAINDALVDKSGDSVVGKIAGSELSVLTRLPSTAEDLVEKYGSYLTGNTMTADSGRGARGAKLTNELRETAQEDMGDVGRFLYGTTMSMADMATTMLLGAATGGATFVPAAAMGIEKASDVMGNAVERGLSPAQTITAGGVSAVTTALTEAIPLGQWEKIAEKGFAEVAAKDVAKHVVNKIAFSMASEGLQEMSEDVADAIADRLIAGDKSEINMRIQELMANNPNLSKEDASEMAWKEWTLQTVLDGLGGAISGGVFGGGASYVGYKRNANLGKNTNRSELAEEINKMDKNSEVYKKYEKIGGGDLSNAKNVQIGELVQEAYEQATKTGQEKFKQGLLEAFINEGISEEDARTYQEAFFAEKRSNLQEDLLKQDEIQRIIDNYNETAGAELVKEATTNMRKIAQTVSDKTGVAKALKKSDLKVGARTELNGEAIKVKDVTKDGDKIVVVTEKGNVNPKELTLSANDAAMVMAASGMTNQFKRQAYFSNYDGRQNVAEYTDAFDTAYNYGKNGVSEEYLLDDVVSNNLLSRETATNIYAAAENEIKKASDSVIEDSENIVKEAQGFRKGMFDDSQIKVDRLSASQRGNYAVAKMFSALGINVSLFNNNSSTSENGWYDPVTKTVHINLSARYYANEFSFDKGYVINTMAHELTHWMEDIDNESYKVLQDAIFNYFGTDGVDRLVAEEQKRHNDLYNKGLANCKTDEERAEFKKTHKEHLSRKAAESEVVARTCEDMLSDADTFEKILMGVNEESRQTIVEKFKAFFEQLGKVLKRIIGMDSPSKSAVALKQNAEVFEQVRQQWINTFTNAVNNIQADVKTLNDAHIEMQDGIAYNKKTLDESWLAANNEEDVEKVGKVVSKYLGVSVEKGKEYVRNLHTIANIEANNKALQYEDTGRSAWVKNAEYGGNFDFSYLCPKRFVYTGTLKEIRKSINKPLTPTMFLALRRFLIDAKYEAPCTYCYVESRRIHTDKYIQEKFIDVYPQYSHTLAQLSDPDYLEKMRTDFLAGKDNGWDKLQKALNIGSGKAKELEKRRAYRGEILTKKSFDEKEVERINYARGLRFFAFSNFEVPHLLDLMQIITDMSVRKLAGFAYTKQAKFVEVFGNTGLKINMSCVAKDVDKNGKIIFDDVEGMNSKDALKLRDKYSENVGIVCVVFTDEQVKAAMMDDRIDYILPFHQSGFSQDMFGMMGLPQGTRDFTNEQTEKWGDETTGNKNEKKESLNIPISSYVGDGLSGREIAQRYLDICNENGYTPVFRSALLHEGGEEILTKKGTHKAWKGGKWVLPEGKLGDGYYKLIIEQKMFDNDGNPAPQRPVMPDFNMDAATKIASEFDENPNTFPVAHSVVDRFLKWEDEGEPLFSTKVDSEGRELTEEQQKFFADDHPIFRDEKGNLKRYYHGTRHGGFTVFERADDNLSYFFTDNLKVANSYAGVSWVQNPDEPMTYDEVAALMEANDVGDLLIGENGKYILDTSDYVLDDKDAERIEFSSLKEAQNYFVNEVLNYEAEQSMSQPTNYAVYLHSTNPLVIDGSRHIEGKVSEIKIAPYRGWYGFTYVTELGEFSEKIGATEVDKYLKENFGDRYEEAKSFVKQLKPDGMTAYDDLEPKYNVVSVKDVDVNKNFPSNWTSISYNGRVGNTRMWSDYAARNGYDSLVLNNVMDNGGYTNNDFESSQVVVVFDPNQIKSIYNENPTVNPDIRYSAKIDDGTYSEIKEHFGVTNNYNVAGYMLRDGTMLDFSGKHWGDTTSRTRQVDHRDIQEVLPSSNNGIDAMVRMISNGNIRLYPESGGINLAVPPTEEQANTLEKYINYHLSHGDKEITIDYDAIDGDTVDSAHYEQGASARQIIKDIESYFRGARQSDLMKFHSQFNDDIRYSLKDDGFEEKDSKTLGLTDERIDKLLSGGWYGASSKNYAQAYIAYMSPDDYLKLTTGKNQRYIDRIKNWNGGFEADGEWDFEKFAEGYNRTPIQLTIDENERKVFGHEGRHRMWQLKQMGYERVPVLMFDYDTKYSKTPKQYMELTPQSFKDEDVYTQEDTVAVRDMIPFGQDYTEEIKRKFGTNSDADVKFSYKVDDETADIIGLNKALEEQNKKLKADVERLNKRLKLEKTITKGKVMKNSDLETVAGMLLREVKSKADKAEVIEGLRDVYGYILDKSNEGIVYDEMMSKAYDVAKLIMNEAKPAAIIDDYFKGIMEDIRRARVKLTPEQIQEAKYTYGNKWRNALMGRITTVNEGRSLDSYWQEWAEMYPNVFDVNTNPNDQLVELSQIYDDLKDASVTMQRFNTHADIMAMAEEVYDKFWNIRTETTTADKHDAEIKKLKFEHRQAMAELKDRQKLLDDMYYGRKIAEYKHRDVKKDAEIVRLKNQYGKMIEKIRERSAKREADLKQFMKDRDARLKNNAERRKLISKITEVSEDLSKRLLKGEKGKKIPQALKAPLAELLTAIDFSSKQLLGINAIKKAGIETKRDIAMSALLNRVSLALQGFNDAKAEGDDAYDLAGLHLPPNYATSLQEIADTIAKVEQTAEGTYVLQYMTAEELNDLYKAIKAIRTAINNVNKIISTNNAHEVDYLGNEIMTDLDKLGQRKIDNAVTQFMSVANRTPYYFFKQMGRGGQEVFSFLQNGWDKLADNVEVIKNFTRGKKKDGSDALYTSQEFEKWKNTVHEFDVLEAPTPDERAEGKEGRQRHITMTEAQIMALYCLSKREQAMGHISRDGIVIDEIKTKKKYGKHEIKKQDAVTLAPTDLGKILSVVTSDARMKHVADKIQEFMNTVCAEWGNEVTMKLYGTEEFTEKNYFPIHVNQEILSTEAKDKSHSIYGMLNQSFTKPLTEGARNEINIADIFDVFNAHASDMAKYNALALPIMDVIKVWNYKENLDRGDEGQREVKAVKKSITKAIGEKGNSYISGLLRDLNGDAESGRYDKTSMRLVKNYKTAAVAANVQTALLQPLAYIRAGYMVDSKYLRKALTRKPKVKECIKDLGVSKWKSMGFYDTNLTRGLDKIISNSDSLLDTIVDKSLWLTEKMDEVTWGYLYTAVELETKDKYPSLSGEKLKEQTIKRLRDVVYGTQVFDSTLARTAMMRSTSALVQMETSFGAEPILSVNMLMDAATEFNQEARRNGLQSAMQKKGRLIARASLVYLISSVVESALRAALKKVRDYDDEDDTFEGITTDILQRTLEELDFLNKIPFVKEAMPYIRKFAYRKLGFEDISKSIYADNTRMDTEVYATIDSAIKSIEKAADGKDLNYKDVQKMAQALSQTTGLPIANVIKEFKVVWNNTIGRATGNTIK